MSAPRRLPTDEQTQADADRQTAGLAGFALVLLLLVVGLFLVHTLYRNATVEDCLMAGHRDCDRLVVKR